MDDIQILHTPTRRPEGAACEVNPTKVFFAKGHKLAEGRRAFATDTIWERDVAVPMRDGAIIRADVFRPATAEGGEPDCQYPALVAWSPYGKESGRDPGTSLQTSTRRSPLS